MASASIPLGYGFGSDPTLPTLPAPPEAEVLASMRAVPAMLALPLAFRPDYRSPYPLHFLLALLMDGGQRPNHDPTKAHSEPAAQWAIRRHVCSNRLTSNGNDVAPADALWEWWRGEARLAPLDDPCGRWLYEKRESDRKTWKAIETEYNSIRNTKCWPLLTLSGIRSRVQRYSRDNNLPLSVGTGGAPRLA